MAVKARRTSWPECEVCGKAASTKDGYLRITWADINALSRMVHDEHKRVSRAVKLEHIVGREERPYWQWGHMACLEGDDYWIAADRIDTLEKAMAWTLHLLEKGWFPASDWERAIRRLYDVGSC